jgi:hypothetical protein
VPKRMTGKRLLGIVEALAWDRIEMMTDVELAALQRGCDRLTSTNCSWSMFQLAPPIRQMANAVIEFRSMQRRAARQKAKVAHEAA